MSRYIVVTDLGVHVRGDKEELTEKQAQADATVRNKRAADLDLTTHYEVEEAA